jgi:tetrapyrrole methylase family protein/MazG family protein
MATRPSIVVVGLGPAGPELITGATTEAIDRIPRRFIRTARHPASIAVPDAQSFDHVYERAGSLVACYQQIVDELVEAAARYGEVLYAVPGSPVVAERTVELLRGDERIDLTTVPAMSFLDLAWTRLAVDPIAAGVRVVDGQRFSIEAAGQRGPLLIAQCDSALVLADIVTALTIELDPVLEPGAEVVVLQRLGAADESIRAIPWRELLDKVEPDHLTSLYIPRLVAPIGAEVERFAELVATLRRECPWDREQTHASLTRHLLEETYEVLDAIDGVDVETGAGYEHLEEELGDLLFQVLFHSTLAAEAGQFTLADVARTVHDKLYLRHPHVFGDVEVDGADDVVRNWEQIKKAEKGRASVFEGIPTHLPALLYALKVQKKASSLAERGVPTPQIAGVGHLVGASAADPSPEDLGAVLFAVVDLARRHGVDPEAALRARAIDFRNQMEEREAQNP